MALLTCLLRRAQPVGPLAQHAGPQFEMESQGWCTAAASGKRPNTSIPPASPDGLSLSAHRLSMPCSALLRRECHAPRQRRDRLHLCRLSASVGHCCSDAGPQACCRGPESGTLRLRDRRLPVEHWRAATMRLAALLCGCLHGQLLLLLLSLSPFWMLLASPSPELNLDVAVDALLHARRLQCQQTCRLEGAVRRDRGYRHRQASATLTRWQGCAQCLPKWAQMTMPMMAPRVSRPTASLSATGPDSVNPARMLGASGCSKAVLQGGGKAAISRLADARPGGPLPTVLAAGTAGSRRISSPTCCGAGEGGSGGASAAGDAAWASLSAPLEAVVALVAAGGGVRKASVAACKEAAHQHSRWQHISAAELMVAA